MKTTVYLTPSVLKELNQLADSNMVTIIQEFCQTYVDAIHQQGRDLVEAKKRFEQLIHLVIQHLQCPYQFELFHQAIRRPFDYYQFGLDFIRPLIDFSRSQLVGIEHVNQMVQQIRQGDNVILLANHQTEPDPQIINLLLEPFYPDFAAQIIFIAGHRVVTDPLAVPISMGCHLLCIYSKKYISFPPEEKPKKLSHNQRTMKKMNELLSEGRKCIYVAPSGGRDRPDENGQVLISSFDAQSIEMFWLMAKRADRPTHFYPLSLYTFPLLPPPRQVEKEVGERRQAHYTPVYLAFGQEVDMENFPGSEGLNKQDKRKRRSAYIWSKVNEGYSRFLTEH